VWVVGESSFKCLATVLLLAVATPAAAQFSPGPLARAHAGIDGPTNCFQCHEPRKSTTAARCLACHDALGARIAAGRGFHGRMDAGRRAQCGACHAEHGGKAAPLVVWPDGKRDAFDHQRTGFALAGKHASLRCEACHRVELVRAADVRAEKNLKMATTFLGLSSRCDACHGDEHRGQFEAQVATGDCAACHAAAAWKPATFDHARARFPLADRHATVACAKCHYREGPGGTRVTSATPGAFVRYRPLEFASCAACHTDPHRGQLGADCARCHTAASWTRAATAGFDHARTRFALQGKHQTVACAKCHFSESAAGKRVAAGTPGSKVRYKPLAFASCTECHRDPHRDRARFGGDCARCHSPASWTAITPGAFDHDQTDYPLRGLHRQVACDRCHTQRDRGRRLAFDRCTACHADAHRGELSRRADRGACESCHTVEGFRPARFGPREHESTQFPLRDAHLAVACIACHRPAAAVAGAAAIPRLRLEDHTCAACHDDPHAAQFATRGGATDCARCHATATWRLPGFDHDRTRFALDGAHRRARCGACHRPVTIAGRTVVRYRPLDTACRSCHGEPRRNGG
jgi:hypothetical protein